MGLKMRVFKKEDPFWRTRISIKQLTERGLPYKQPYFGLNKH